MNRINMLEFYYRSSSNFTEKIACKLEGMVVAHKIREVKNPAELPVDTEISDLPFLRGEHDLWQSEQEIKVFLDGLHQDLNLSRSMQSDACHLDPENPDECL